MLKKVTPRIKNVAHARLSKIPGLVEHPGFRFDLGLEGYKNYTFGGKAGPGICMSNVFHEIAHAIEFGNSNFRKRVSVRGYVFKSPKTKFLFGQFFQEYNKHSAIERELRTVAIQVKLMKLSGIKKTEQFLIEDIVSAMKYMPDFDNVPVTAENRTDEQKIKWCEEYVQRHIQFLDTAELLKELFGWLDKSRKAKHFSPII